MIKEPVKKGAAFLIRFQKKQFRRDLLLLISDISLSFLREVSGVIREISAKYPDWKIKTAGIQDAAFPLHEVSDIDPGYFCFDVRHFASSGSANDITVHRDLLSRVIERLLSETPGIDFIQKSGIARGLRYFDRPKVREDLLRQAMEIRWILLEALRRFGKTSFLVNLEDIQPEDIIAIYVSLESGTSPDYLTRAMLAQAMVNSKLRVWMAPNLKEGIEKDWSATEILEHITTTNKGTDKDLRRFWQVVSKRKKKILFLLDEVAIYLQNVENSLSTNENVNKEPWKGWLKERFNLLNSAPDEIRFVLAGSIHLPAFLEAHEISLEVFKKAKSVPLSPVSGEDIETFLRLAMLQEKTLAQENEIAWILEHFGGWLPSFLIYFIDLLARECRDHDQLSQEEIQSIYKSLFGPKHRDLFTDLDEQPKRYGNLFDPSLSFTWRLQHLLVKAADNEVSREEVKQAFHQARDYPSSIEQSEKEKLSDLAIKIACQDFSLEIKEEKVQIHCPLLADWIRSRKMEWRVS